MRREAIQTNWDMIVAAELIERYGTVQNLNEAKEEKEKVKNLLEIAEENLRRQGKKISHL